MYCASDLDYALTWGVSGWLFWRKLYSENYSILASFDMRRWKWKCFSLSLLVDNHFPPPQLPMPLEKLEVSVGDCFCRILQFVMLPLCLEFSFLDTICGNWYDLLDCWYPFFVWIKYCHFGRIYCCLYSLGVTKLSILFSLPLFSAIYTTA